MIRPDKQHFPAVLATWRDGFDPGDLLGGLVTGVLTFATLAALRRLRTS